MNQDAKDNRILGALAYIFFLFVLPLGKKDSAFCQFHAKQGIVLFIAWILVSFLGWIPFVGWAAWVSLLVLNIMAIYKALNGEMWELPWLGDFAKKIKI